MLEEKSKTGFIKFYRSILDWEWYSDTNTMRIFIHCLLKANYQDKKWQGITIQRGSFITSLENLAFETGLSVMQVRTALKKLNVTNEITSQSTSRNTLITVNNYDKYQADNTPDNKQITNEQQTDNKQITTTNKYKNIRNKEYIDNSNTTNIIVDEKQQTKTKKFIKPTIEEIKSYCTERNNGIDANFFYDYYESKGWQIGKNPMKDWKAAVRTWERKNFNKGGDNNAGTSADSRRNPNESKYSRANGWF